MAYDVLDGDWPEASRVVRGAAVVAQDEDVERRNRLWSVASPAFLHRPVFLKGLPADVDQTTSDLYRLARQPDHALYEHFALIRGVDDHDVSTTWSVEAIANLLDHHPLRAVQGRFHTLTQDLGSLRQEKVDEQRDDDGRDDGLTDLAESPEQPTHTAWLGAT